MKKRILLVEDEEHLHEAIRLNLELEDYDVVSVFKGKEAINKFRQGRYDLIVLDIMLPEVNGFDICQTIRLEDNHTPILFLTAKNSAQDRIKGLKIGGDDYLAKPFNLEEFLLRVQKLIQRTSKSESLVANLETYTIGGSIINFKSFEVVDEDENSHKLTQRQIKLLKLLIDKKDEVVSRQEILEKVWGYDVYPSTRTIDNVILSFRKIFEKNVVANTYLKSVRGVGYKFTPSNKI